MGLRIGVHAGVVNFREGDAGAGAARVGDVGGIGTGREGCKEGGIFAAHGEGEGTETGDFGGVVFAPVIVLGDEVGALVDLDRGIGQGARQAEGGERRAGCTDEDFLGIRTADDKAGDEDRFTGADFGAGGEVNQTIGALSRSAQP